MWAWLDATGRADEDGVYSVRAGDHTMHFRRNDNPDGAWHALLDVAHLPFDMDKVEGAMCEGRAVEAALRAHAQDPTAPPAQRVEAAIVSGWVGTHDPCIQTLEPWMARLALQCLEVYPVCDTDSDALREYHPVAVGSMERILGIACSFQR